jgi:hypothetical protein
MRTLLALAVMLCAISGCADMPQLKNGKLLIGKDTSLGARNGTVAEVSNRF